MKKVYECIVSELATETYDDFDYQEGLVDHVCDPFDGEEPINLLDNAVKLEKGQEALFKVTVTTTVELIDIRKESPYEYATLVEAPERAEGEHADGCGFFYGNPCGCGFETPLVMLTSGYGKMSEPELVELEEALATPVPPGPVCSCYCKGINAAAHPVSHAISCPVFKVYQQHSPIQTTQTPAKLVWHCDVCNTPFPSAVTAGFRESCRAYLTCPECNCGREHTLKLQAEEKPKLAWECMACHRQVPGKGLSAHHIEGYQLNLCCPCKNGWTEHTLKRQAEEKPVKHAIASYRERKTWCGVSYREGEIHAAVITYWPEVTCPDCLEKRPT